MQIIALPAFKDNYIWVLREKNSVAVVDPGDAAPVLAYLAREKAVLSAILTTHHHADHVGGIPALLAAQPVPVFGLAGDPIPHLDHPLADGQDFTVPGIGLTLTLLAVPGHTRGHGAYYATNGLAHPVLFSGDTLFGCGCGRLFEGTPAQMFHSLSRLAALPADTRVYCAHEYTQANIRFALTVEPGNENLRQRARQVDERRAAGLPTVPSLLAEELATNPFLRSAEPAIQAAASEHSDQTLSEPVRVFATIREWKDGY